MTNAAQRKLSRRSIPDLNAGVLIDECLGTERARAFLGYVMKITEATKR